MIPASVMTKLATLGLSAAHAEAVAEMLAAVEMATKNESSAALEARRASDRERKARQRHGTSRDITGQAVTSPSPYTEDAPTHAEPEPNKTTSPPPTSFAIAHDVAPQPVAKPKSTNAECVKALASVLDAEHAAAVVEHRNRIRKPMTAHGAALLAKSLSQAPNPNAAADEMIERGWQGWKPHWGQGPPRRPEKRNTALDGLDELERRFSNAPDQHTLRIAG